MEAQEIIATPPAVPLWSSIKEALRTPEGEMVLESLLDRKSTRLNSSHLVISYAVFCLKKKNAQVQPPPLRRGRSDRSLGPKVHGSPAQAPHRLAPHRRPRGARQQRRTPLELVAPLSPR